jgi:acetoin utilization deacetylase AcuC-like enzyme
LLAAYITHTDCQKHDMGNHHPESPERLGAVNDQLLIKGLLDYMEQVDAPLATREQLARAHSVSYLDEFAEIAQQVPEGGRVQIDPDTNINEFSYQAALRSAGAAVLAANLVASEQAPVAFCNIRPPGHHAERSNAGGFCFFNNIVVGIRHAMAQHGIERIALIDFDVHHGNGSEDILFNDPGVLMCSIFEKNLYPFCGDVPMGSNMINVGLPSRSGSDAFRQAVREVWIPALDKFQPEMIFISAGFDAHREDDMGNLALVEADYEWVTKQLVQIAQRYAHGRIVSCLEGGYDLSSLGRSAAAHVRVLIGAD